MRTRQIGMIVLAGAAVLSAALPALAQEVRPFARPFGPHLIGPWMGAAFGLFLLLRLLFVVGLVVVVWRLLGAGGLWHRPDSAVQVLRERYARGEIGEEEYRKRLGTLV